MRGGALGAAGALALALMMALTGCTKHSATSASSAAPAHSSIPTTSDEHNDLVKGKALLISCVPNGQAMVGSVLDGTASGLTYLQDAHFIASGGLHKVFTCVATKPGPVPAPAMKKSLEDCAVNQVTPIIKADHHFIRDRHTILPAVLNAAAICIGKYAA
jgi:hypothetical protein